MKESSQAVGMGYHSWLKSHFNPSLLASLRIALSFPSVGKKRFFASRGKVQLHAGYLSANALLLKIHGLQFQGCGF